MQWEILRTAFHGHRTLVLIGDPKQAIYAFRGADVVTYLAARRRRRPPPPPSPATGAATSRCCAASTHLLGGAALGDDARSWSARSRPRTPAAASTAAPPLRLRQVTRAALRAQAGHEQPAGSARSATLARRRRRRGRRPPARRRPGCATATPGARCSPATSPCSARRNADAAAGPRRPRRRRRARRGLRPVQRLRHPGRRGTGSPCSRALEQPGHAGRTAALALTPFVGWDAARLAERDRRRARRARPTGCAPGRGCSPTAGVAALLEAATADGLAERLLRTTTGERHADRPAARRPGAARRRGRRTSSGTAALTDWLRRRIDEAGEDYAEERSRRLETDAAAVQVVTVHASKGLEFPVVYVPVRLGPLRAPRPRRSCASTTTPAPGCCTSAARGTPATPPPGPGTWPRSAARTCACSTSR